MTDDVSSHPPVSDSVVSPARQIHQIAGWRKVATWPLSLVVRAWCRTLRFEVSPADLAAGRFAERPAVLLLWHNCLFAVPFIVRSLRSQRTVKALISASKDGAWLTCFFKDLGITAVRGSSSRLGREALRQLIMEQRAGHDIAITPDGPRGPMYEMKPGALLAARVARAPLILIGLRFHRAWRTRSWDRFRIPYPFSRVTVRCEKIEPGEWERGHEALQQLRDRLLILCGEDPRRYRTSSTGVREG